eukprot:gene17379-19117_t
MNIIQRINGLQLLSKAVRSYSGYQNLCSCKIGFYSRVLGVNLPKTKICAGKLQKRLYASSSGEYEKLWAAATGGRGTGRGRKKRVDTSAKPENLAFGKAQILWPGLSKPIKLGHYSRDDKDEFETAQEQRERRASTGLARQRLRGWSGYSWPGKHVGQPHNDAGMPMEGFDSIVIEVKRTAVQKTLGKKRTVSAVVVTGNRKGVVGWAIGKGQSPVAAIRKARNKAANYLHNIPVCDGHTIFHNFKTKYEATEIVFERRPAGHGLRCQRIIKAICQLAGIQDIRCKLVGSNTPQRVVRAAFQGLESQESHQELAERTGKMVVEFRQEMGGRPVVVATPSLKSVEERIDKELNETEDDISKYFDPTRGMHKAKYVRAKH